MTGPSSPAGALVAVCGIDGSGKTTQLQHLCNRLSASREVVRTRQPTDLYRGDPLVRRMLDQRTDDMHVLHELALFAAFDRARHLREIVRPALDRGATVVTDRYVYSSYAYFLARGLPDVAWLVAINRDVPEPDLTIYLDVPPELAIRRVHRRDGASKKREEVDVERMSLVREHFLARPWGPSDRYFVVDGTRSCDVVTKSIDEIVDTVLWP